MANVEEKLIPRELVSGVGFIDYNSPVSQARQELKDAPAIIVTKDGEYFGVIDSRVLHGTKSGRVSGSEKIGKLAIRAPSVSDTSSVEDLAYYFYKLRIKNLPYVDNGKITGVVERSTLLKMLLSLHILDQVRVSDD